MVRWCLKKQEDYDESQALTARAVIRPHMLAGHSANRDGTVSEQHEWAHTRTRKMQVTLSSDCGGGRIPPSQRHGTLPSVPGTSWGSSDAAFFSAMVLLSWVSERQAMGLLPSQGLVSWEAAAAVLSPRFADIELTLSPPSVGSTVKCTTKL